MAALVFQITDGTTAINLDGTGDYDSRVGWRPNVATRRRDNRGNVSPFNDVVEEIPITITGADIDDVDSNEAALVNLIDQAQRWYDGENVSPVLFKYRQADSTLTNPVQCAIIGYAGPVLEHLDNDFMFVSNNLARRSILRFARRGRWLGDEESDASSSTNNPGIMTATNTASSGVSPLRLEMTNFVNSSWGSSFLLVTDDTDKIDIFSMFDDTATGFTSVSDASLLPLQVGGFILRYTPTGTDWAESGQHNIDALLLTNTRRIAIFCSFRRNSAATTAQAKVRILPHAGASNEYTYVETVPISITQTSPQWYPMGELLLPMGISVANAMYLTLWLKTNNTSSTVDIDAMCIMDMDTEMSQIISMRSDDVINASRSLYVDHRELTKPFPRTYQDSTLQAALVTNGNMYLQTQAAEVAAIWLATSADTFGSSDEYWCAVNPISAARLANVLTAVRRPGYLTPQ